MKDPLQTEQTPYEVLGIERGASAAEVDRAFMGALRERLPYNKAKNAKDALQRPERRAWYDLLEYDREALAESDSSALDDLSVLDPVRRAATAQRWQKALKRSFPDLVLVHSLGVFWYWWAKHEEERFSAMLGAAMEGGSTAGELTKVGLLRQIRRADGGDCDPSGGAACGHRDCAWRQDCLSSAPSLPKMWEAVIAYWSLLASAREFWDGRFGLTAQEVEALRERFVSSLRNELLDLAQHYDRLRVRLKGAASPGSLAEQYRALELCLTVELKTARSLAEVGVRTQQGKFSCGALMLRRMGLLGAARSQVAAALSKRRSSGHLQRLRDTLSSHSTIAVLVQQSKPEAALRAIADLPSTVQKSKDVRNLRVQALHMLAKQKASLDSMDEALSAWDEALRSGHDKGLATEIRSEIASTCHARAAAMQRTRRDEAIGLLEKALALAGDDSLKATLAELLTERGVTHFREGQKKADQMPPRLSSLLREASNAAGREDWDTAIDGLRKASSQREPTKGKASGERREGLVLCKKGLSDLERAAELGSSRGKQQLEAGRNVLESLGQNWHETVSKNLATSLTNRGARKANRASEMLSKAAEAHHEGAEALLGLLKGSGGQPFSAASLYGPDICAMSGCIMPATHTMAPPGSSPIPLCPLHVDHVKKMLAPPEPSQEAIDLLLSAEEDLDEAAKLDPTSDHVRKNRESLGKLLSSIKQATGRKLVSSGGESQAFRDLMEALNAEVSKAPERVTRDARRTVKRSARRAPLSGEIGSGIASVFKGFWWVFLLALLEWGLVGLAGAIGIGIAIGIIVGFVGWARGG